MKYKDENSSNLEWKDMFPAYGLIRYFRENKKPENLFEAACNLINFSLICTYNIWVSQVISEGLEKILS